MSLITTISEIVEVLTELKQLKVALGFDENASIVDIITQIKAAQTQLAAVAPGAVTAPAA